MAPLRILHVVTTMNRGGLETLLINLFRNMDREKVVFDFLVHRKEHGAYEEEIEELGGKIYRVSPITPFSLAKYNAELALFFSKHHEYTIVHSHLDTLSTFVLKAAKKQGVHTRIAHSHAAYMMPDIRALFRICSRAFLKNYATDLFACSMLSAKWLYGKKCISDPRVVIFKNAISSKSFVFDADVRDTFRNKYHLSDKFVIGHVGRFAYEKNHDFLLDVFEEIQKKKPNAILLLVGVGPLESKIRTKIASLLLDDKVIFIGDTSRTQDYLQAMDAFIFPSHAEGLGIALIEAQASGLNCLASDTIPRETNITPLVTYMSLREPVASWVEWAIQLPENSPRKDTSLAIISSGYDIDTNVKWLEHFYTANRT